ncbi:MAG: right-handed parallel beta-helix repeat-containing protein, partial [Planctomycetia bacterium]
SASHPTGARTDPFPSLVDAQAAIRARLANGPQLRDIVVNIRGATYDLNGPVVFSAADSGRNGRTVTWQAAPGETPVFSGSRPVTNWQLVLDPHLYGLGFNAVWKADVSSLSVAGRSELRARQLSIDGVRGTIAESNPSAMPGDQAPTYPFGFRPLNGQYTFFDGGQPVVGVAYSNPFDLFNTNPIDWRFPTSWDQVEGLNDPRRQQDVEAVARMQWREFRMPVEAIGGYDPFQIVNMPSLFDDVSVGMITMQADPWYAASLGVAPQNASPGAPPQEPLAPAIWNPWRITQFANSYQFLDQPNEWYHDRVGRSVYLVCAPFVNPNLLDVEIPVAESLLQVQGTAANPVRNLAFKGITFTGATWLDPSFGAGYVPDQAGVLIDAGRNPVTGDFLNELTTTGHSKFTKATPGNVAVAFARNVEFSNNVFQNLGGVGLQLGMGAQGVRVIRNTFTSISSCAITVGGASWCRVDASIDPNQPQTKWVIDPVRRITVLGTDAFPGDRRAAVADNVILQNTITGTGEDYVDASGIFVGFARNTRIENNRISDTSWSGMQIGWGWGLVDSPRFPGQPNSTVSSWLPTALGVPTALGGTKVIGNVITNFVTQVYDGGAIYTAGAQGSSWANATVIKGNELHSKRPLAGSNVIYTDGGTRWVIVQNNLQYDNQRGQFWMGADFSLFDRLNVNSSNVYGFFPLINGISYGSEIGGCIPAGNIRYVGNLWENRWAGTSYPFPLARRDDPTIPAFANVSDWPNNPLFYNPAPQPYYGLTTGLSFVRNKFLLFNQGGDNPAISAWRARQGYGTRWKPGAD